jgi:DNA polymerase-1
MYGATTGDSGRLVPALRRAYPRAMGLVDAAAATGEQGGVVSTWLGRTSVPAHRRTGATSSPPPRCRRRRRAIGREHGAAGRDRGRFTRNFVRARQPSGRSRGSPTSGGRLAALPPVDERDAARNSGAVFEQRPHLAFFLHDEIIVHTPVVHADAVADVRSGRR